MRVYIPEEHPFSIQPLLHLVVPFLLGIWAADYGFGSLRDMLPVAAAICFSGVIGLSLLTKKVHAAWTASAFITLLWTTSVTGGACLLIAHRTHTPELPAIEETTMQVVVDDAIRTTGKTFRTTARVHGGALHGHRLQFSLMRNDSTPRPAPGDILLCHTTPIPPTNAGNPFEPDYAGYQRRQGISGTAFCFTNAWRATGRKDTHPTWRIRALQWREKLTLQYASHLEGRELAIVSALTLGDKSLLDSDTREIYADSGVSHVLALSGLHLGILFFIYQSLVLRPFTRHRSIYIPLSVIGLLLLWSFTLIAGLPLSLIRAAVMFSLLQAVGWMRRKGNSMSHLIVAAWLILLFDPQALFDVGFQLSFTSVLSILILMPRIPVPAIARRRYWARALYNLPMVSLCAQIGTAPLVAYHFHQLPTYGIIANFIAVPMAYLVLGAVVLFFIVPFLQGPLGALLSAVVGTANHLLSAISEWPGATIHAMPTATTVACLYSLLFLLLLWHARKRVRYVYVCIALIIAGTFSESRASGQRRVAPQVVFYNIGSTPAVHFLSTASQSYLWSTKFPESKRALGNVRKNYWRVCNIDEPIPLSGGQYDTADLMKRGPLVSFRGVRIALLASPLPSRTSAAPVDVDILFLAKGYNRDLEQALRLFRPQRIVLDSSLSEFYARKFRKEAKKAGLPFFDIRQSGAYILKL